MKSLMGSTHNLGRALLLPLAVLPVAGLVWRLGQPDALDLALMTSAGDAILANLGVLFAMGIALGLARQNNGVAALAALVGALVATQGALLMIGVPPEVVRGFETAARAAAAAAYKAQVVSMLSLPLGILSGLIAAGLSNRFGHVQLPGFLSFFGGQRLLAIATGGAGALLAIAVGLSWPILEMVMESLSQTVLTGGTLGLFAFGALTRLLLVTGLQHMLENAAWFHVGTFHEVSGDLRRFMAGDPDAGAFMAGYFPVAIFGLPAACLAMYRSVSAARRRMAGGLMLAMALTSVITGFTQPIEFTIMFLAPGLYVLHALLSGASMVVMDLLQCRLGFSAAAGLTDYLINFQRASDPWLLLPVGLVTSLIYYSSFRFCIVRFNLQTPGRDGEVADEAEQQEEQEPEPIDVERADAYLAAFGGGTNIRSIDACATRLRLELVSRTPVDTRALKRMGARGIAKYGTKGAQVVLGEIAREIAADMNARLAQLSAPAGTGGRAEKRRSERLSGGETIPSGAQVIAALGGRENVEQLEAVSGRVLIRVVDAGLVDEEALRGLGVRGVAILEPDRVHLLHANAEGLMGQLDAQMQ
jgi:PTS system N-acetylglucosamine-specific IIC component